MKKYLWAYLVTALFLAAGYLLANNDVPDRTFSREQLARFNGDDGEKAYVAIDGIVYDVTPVKEWSGGRHKHGLRAGKDHSFEIIRAPHGKTVLRMLSKVGRYRE
ncbi:MAG: cytochrome b5 domain-containing protein [Spirochaetota bacterium]